MTDFSSGMHIELWLFPRVAGTEPNAFIALLKILKFIFSFDNNLLYSVLACWPEIHYYADSSDYYLDGMHMKLLNHPCLKESHHLSRLLILIQGDKIY